jgi:hypothetical protein
MKAVSLARFEAKTAGSARLSSPASDRAPYARPA